MDPEQLKRRMGSSSYLSLVSFKRSGEAVATPVWFAISNDKMIVRTEDPSGKLKRIRNNPRVDVAPCSVRGKQRGPEFAASARILGPHEQTAAERALLARFGAGRRLFYATLGRLFAAQGKGDAYLEITPVADRVTELDQGVDDARTLLI